MARRKKDEFESLTVEVDPGILPVEEAERIPVPDDPEWDDYLMGQLLDKEKDSQGYPKVNGLRRLTRKHIGDIVLSRPNTIQAPNVQNGLHACVEWLLHIEDSNGRLLQYGDVADVYAGNTDGQYARFASATAGTRAEARALRKALMLSTVSSEELTALPVSEAGLTGLATPDQLRVIEKTCRDLNISVLDIIKDAGYSKIEHLNYESAQKMCAMLMKWFNNRSLVPNEFGEYNSNWRSV